MLASSEGTSIPYYVSIQRQSAWHFGLRELRVDLWYLGLWVGGEEGGKKMLSSAWMRKGG